MAANALAALMPLPAAGQQQSETGTYVELGYPAEALAAGLTGTVVVRLTTDASSRVAEAEVVQGPEIFRSAVLANVRQWTLPPRWPALRTEYVTYTFAIVRAECNIDSRGLFRLHYGTLAVVTACSDPGRQTVGPARDEAPVASYGTPPPYLEVARRAAVQGLSVLDLSVDATGRVTDVQVLLGSPLLTHNAVESAKTWRVRTTSPLRKIVVYEFLLNRTACAPVEHSAFLYVAEGHLRITACQPIYEINVTSGAATPDAGSRR